MASKSAIWRATSNGAEGSNTSDRVEFNDFALTDSNMKVITQTTGILESAVAVNPKPKSAVDELQDTGFSSLTLSVVGSVKDPSDDGLDAAYLFKTWLLEDKTNASFPKGRFGFPG